MLENERAWRDDAKISAGIFHIWRAMQACTQRGLNTEGRLPGGLNVKRRAASLHQRLTAGGQPDNLSAIDWLNVYAMAVNEENAAGGRVVTAPTTGAAGVIPAVAHYYLHLLNGTEDGIARYFLAAAAIGVLYAETPPSPVRKSAARARWEWLAPWPPPDSPPCSAEPMSKWSTPPRSPWNTTSA